MEKLIIAFEGIDGSGKSTLVQRITNESRYRFEIYRRTEKWSIIDKLVSSRFLRKHYMFQVPIYILLSNINYIKYLLNRKNGQVIIMDRCFLSNICYFYPNALQNENLLRRIMYFEPLLLPDKIFVFDVTPTIAQLRDLHKKDIDWLTNTRNTYLRSESSELLQAFDIEILDESLTLNDKEKTIVDYIEGKLKNGY